MWFCGVQLPLCCADQRKNKRMLLGSAGLLIPLRLPLPDSVNWEGGRGGPSLLSDCAKDQRTHCFPRGFFEWRKLFTCFWGGCLKMMCLSLPETMRTPHSVRCANLAFNSKGNKINQNKVQCFYNLYKERIFKTENAALNIPVLRLLQSSVLHKSIMKGCLILDLKLPAAEGPGITEPRVML